MYFKKNHAFNYRVHGGMMQRFGAYKKILPKTGCAEKPQRRKEKLGDFSRAALKNFLSRFHD